MISSLEPTGAELSNFSTKAGLRRVKPTPIMIATIEFRTETCRTLATFGAFRQPSRKIERRPQIQSPTYFRIWGRILFGLCVCGSRSGGTRHSGLLRCGGRAVCGIRGAAGYQRKGNNSKAGDDYFFHSKRLGRRLDEGYGVEPYLPCSNYLPVKESLQVLTPGTKSKRIHLVVGDH
jgi:hypothetical protein